jgi:transcription antitermination factor NusG
MNHRALVASDSIASKRQDGYALPWFALQVTPFKEMQIERSLIEKGLETYLPTQRSLHTSKARMKLTPLFCGYLFCRINLEDRSILVVTTPGVQRILGRGREPAPVSETEIESMQRAVASGLELSQHPGGVEGCTVLVVQGVLTGLKGIIIRSVGKDSLGLQVPSVNITITVRVDRSWVIPLCRECSSQGDCKEMSRSI